MSTQSLSAELPALRRQGIFFCVVACLALACTPLLAIVNDQYVLICAGLAIFFLGVPHGALDTVFARKIYRLNTPLQWLIFTAAYVSLAAAIVVIWWVAPRIFLASFLLISAFHFSADPVIPLSMGARMLYGGAVMILPAMLHAPQITVLFAQLVGIAAADDIVSVLQAASIPWLIADLILVGVVLRTDRVAGCEILGAVLLALLASPLIAFTLFFCVMHSPRHFLRTALLVGEAPKNLLMRAAFVPTAACFFASLLAMSLSTHLPIDDRFVRIIFVGLAALTVPHIAIVERVRYRGWRFKSD